MKNKVEEDLMKFLNMLIEIKGENSNFKYSGIEDFVKENGEFNIVQVFPAKYNEYRGKKKECFMNSYKLSQSTDLIYVEGMAMKSNLPLAIHHAWCIDRKGRVVDPTWDDQEDCAYYGVAFNENYILQTVLRTHHYGILDNYIDGFPLLKGAEGHRKIDFGFN